MICAEHFGYRNMMAVHRRTLKRISTRNWEIMDLVYSPYTSKQEYKIDLNWLLPDWPFSISGNICTLSAPFGFVKLHIYSDIKTALSKFTLYKKGKSLTKDQEDEPLLGWYSPTYGYKIPALSLRYSATQKLPVTITSRFTFS